MRHYVIPSDTYRASGKRGGRLMAKGLGSACLEEERVAMAVILNGIPRILLAEILDFEAPYTNF